MLLNVNLKLPIEVQNFFYTLKEKEVREFNSLHQIWNVEEHETKFLISSKYTGTYLATILKDNIFSK